MNETTRTWRSRTSALLSALFVLCALLRVAASSRQSLWADELFSLAMATGHSLEHPPQQANPARGDYVEERGAVPARVYAQYLDHAPAASAASVLRAVTLSDTSPPLYYLLLSFWTRVCGTGDGALRSFSILCALAAFPVVVSLARRAAGRAAMLPAAVVYTFAPLSIHYSSEGRMYSLLWLLAACLLWLTLRLRARGAAPGLTAAWVAASAGGLLTHYFFAPVWIAAVAWLLVRPGRCPRRAVALAFLAAGLLALPWYVHVAHAAPSWRVTAGWLHMRPEDYHAWRTPLELVATLASGHMPWLLSRTWLWLHTGAFLALVPALFVRPIRVLGGPRGLLWLCFAAACATPLLADLWLRTYAGANPRYALAGLPAAVAVVALLASRLSFPARAAFLVAISLVGLVATRNLRRSDARNGEPFGAVGRVLGARAGAADVVIVHSIPSGVAGVARYLAEAGGTEVPLASWVGALKRRRVPGDIEALASGRRRVYLVEIHAVGEPVPQAAWLLQHARQTSIERIQAASISTFEMRPEAVAP